MGAKHDGLPNRPPTRTVAGLVGRAMAEIAVDVGCETFDDMATKRALLDEEERRQFDTRFRAMVRTKLDREIGDGEDDS